MANGQQKAQQNVDAFIVWSSSQTDDDFKQITHRGQLSRSEIAKAAGFSKSSLVQNPRLRDLLANLESDLRERGILPELSLQGEELETQPKTYDKTASKQLSDAKRIAELEQEVLSLKMKQERLRELSEVLVELGLE